MQEPPTPMITIVCTGCRARWLDVCSTLEEAFGFLALHRRMCQAGIPTPPRHRGGFLPGQVTVGKGRPPRAQAHDESKKAI